MTTKLIHIHYRKLGKYTSLKREKGSQRKKQKELKTNCERDGYQVPVCMYL